MEAERMEPHAGKDAEFSAVLADYLLAVDRGAAPDRDAFLADYPDFAERIQAFFAGQDELESLAAPLRPAPAAPTAIGTYDLAEEIGRGGMGVVVRGRDRVLKRDLAVKILLERYCDRPDLVRRFVKEAQITGQLQHPYIVPIHELGILPDGRPFIAMKLVAGRTFADLLADRPSPAHDLDRCLHIFEQVSQTIAYAHSKGVIHRDLKPANVMVGAFGEVQVMDWGLAKVLGEPAPRYPTPLAQATGEGMLQTVRGEDDDSNTRTGVVLGTLAFMPPEQAAGDLERVDRRSDVFGLGAILCTVLTGDPPYIGEPAEVRELVRAGATAAAWQRLDRCGADPELIDLTQRCLASDPAARPADAGAVLAALTAHFTAVRERLQQAEIARAQAETEAIEHRKQAVLAEAKAVAEQKRARAENRRRRATLLLAGSLLLLVAVAAGCGLWVQDQQARRAAELAAREADTDRDVTAALREVTLLQAAGVKQADDPEQWRQTLVVAQSALKRAEDALNLGEPGDALRTQVGAVRSALAEDDRDCKLLADLDRVMDDYMNNANGNIVARAAQAYERVFRAYGWPLLDLPAAEMARKLASHRLRTRLWEAIENWAFFVALRADGGVPTLNAKQTAIVFLPICDWDKAERLLQVLHVADPDPGSFRRRWHEARTLRNTRALLHMAETADPLSLGPLGIVNLVNDLRAAGEMDAEVRLLRKAVDAHRGHYLLYAALGAALQSRESGAPAEAVRYLTAAAALRNRSPNAHVWLSMALDNAGNREDALREARRAVALDARSVSALQWLAALLVRQGDEAAGMEHLERAVAVDETADKAHAALGTVLVTVGRSAEGMKHLLRAVELAPQYGAHYFNLGGGWQETGETNKAIEAYREAIRLVPVDALARIQLASLLAATNDAGGAVQELERAIKSQPRNPDYHFALAEIYARQGEPAKALACIRAPVERDPQSSYAHLKLSEFFMQRDAFAALHAARKAFDLEQQPDTIINLLRALLKTAATTEAKQRGDEALKRFPQDAAIHDAVGTVYYWSCEFRQALAHHQRAIALAPRMHVYHENLGLVLRAIGEFEKAAEAFHKTTVLKKKRSSAHHLLADVMNNLNRHDEAAVAAEKAIACNKNNLEAYITLARAHSEQNEFLKAKEALQRVQSLPLPGPYLANLKKGFGHFDALEQARRDLPAVLAGNNKPDDVMEYLRYGSLCARLERRRHALAGLKLLQAAFATDAGVEVDNVLRPRFAGVLCALAAATGRSQDSRALDADQCAKLRRQALAWLRTDLARLQRSVTGNPNDRVPIHWMLRQWQQHPELADVREPDALAALPTEERTEWMRWWNDVAAFRSKLRL